MCRVIYQWSMSAWAFIRRRWPVRYTNIKPTHDDIFCMTLDLESACALGCVCLYVCMTYLDVYLFLCVFLSMSVSLNVRSDKPHLFACNIVASLLLRLKRLQGFIYGSINNVTWQQRGNTMCTNHILSSMNWGGVAWCEANIVVFRNLCYIMISCNKP